MLYGSVYDIQADNVRGGGEGRLALTVRVEWSSQYYWEIKTYNNDA